MHAKKNVSHSRTVGRPQTSKEGQEVLLRDLHPNAPQKWRHAVILCKQGLFNI